MKPLDVYGNKWSLFITKMIVNLVVKEQYSLMIIFYQRNITFELRAENGQHCTCTHVTGCICDLHFANVSKITQTQDRFSLVDTAWKHPKYPCFCILPLEFEVNNDMHKHENSEVIYSNRNKFPKEMSGNSRLQKHGKHINRFHLTKYTG